MGEMKFPHRNTATVGTPELLVWRTENFEDYENNGQIFSFKNGKTYGYYYRVNNSMEQIGINSVLSDGEKETGHWVGFKKPKSLNDAKTWWALPVGNTYKYLWEIKLVVKFNECKGFVDFPRFGNITGTEKVMNLNNSAAACVIPNFLGEL